MATLNHDASQEQSLMDDDVTANLDSVLDSDALEVTSDAPSESAIVVNATALASSMRIPPAYSARVVNESKGATPRVSHTTVSYEGTMYVYGGRSPTGQYFPSISRYVPSRLAWVELESKGVQPTRRGDHSAVVVDDKMYVLGGRKQSLLLDDMHVYDFILNTWEHLTFEVSGGPGAIFNHCACYSANVHTMFVTGGVHVQQNRRHLVFGFDLRGCYWKPIRGPPTVDASELHVCQCCVDDAAGVLLILGLKEDPTLTQLYTDMTRAVGGDGELVGPGSNMPQQEPALDGDIGSGERSGSLVESGGYGSVRSGMTQPPQDKAKSKMARVAETAFTMMHMMDVHTHIWKRIRTELAPETPIPFTMEHVTHSVVAFLSKQPHTSSQSKRLWYFPVNLRELDEAMQESNMLASAPGGPASAKSSSSTAAKRRGKAFAGSRARAGGGVGGGKQSGVVPAPQAPSWATAFGFEYGMFVMSLAELKWFLIPVVVPKNNRSTASAAPDDHMQSRREFFSLRNAHEFETKYSLTCHAVKSAGGTRELLVMYGGTNLLDYSLCLLTPTIPPKPRGRALEAAAKKQHATAWTMDDEEDGGVDEDVDDDGVEPTTIARLTPPQPFLRASIAEPPTSSGGGAAVSGTARHPLRPVALATGGTVHLKRSAASKRRGDDKDGPTKVAIPLHASLSTTHATSSLHQHETAPPVIRFESKEKLQNWIQQYYRDECKWMTEERFDIEKQFAVAKRLATKQKHAAKRKGADDVDGDVLGLPALPQNSTGGTKASPSDRSSARRAVARRRPGDAREERIRAGAVVGTLLFDAVDLHPHVQPRMPQSPRRQSQRRSIFASTPRRLSSGAVPLSPTHSDAGRSSAQEHTIPLAMRMHSGATPESPSAPSPTVEQPAEPVVSAASRIAQLNWALLRRHVVSGEAARILSKVEEEKHPDISWWIPHAVSSASKLVLNPALSTFQIVKGAGKAGEENRRLIALIPTKPVPYTIESKYGSGQLTAKVGPAGDVNYSWKTLPAGTGRPS